VTFVEFANLDRMQGFNEWSLVLKDDIGRILKASGRA
jgi:hypothetical protein